VTSHLRCRPCTHLRSRLQTLRRCRAWNQETSHVRCRFCSHLRKPSTYFKADILHVVAQQTHLTVSQRNDLHEIFDRHAPLFRGKVGTYIHKKFHIILKPDAVPNYQQRPFPVAIQHRQLLKDELDRQESGGIIARCYESAWVMPSFILPKKDNKIFGAVSAAILEAVFRPFVDAELGTKQQAISIPSLRHWTCTWIHEWLYFESDIWSSQ
jgi:hypothetical protein